MQLLSANSSAMCYLYWPAAWGRIPVPSARFAPLQLAGSGVSISIAYPPDTDTPGYENEKSLMVSWR